MPRFARWLLISALAATAWAAHAAEPTVDFVVVRSDTLIGLANSVLVSPAAWREVAALNKLPDPNRIRPGQVLTIPTRLLRGGPVDARVLIAVGEVRSGDAAVTAGAVLAEGQSLETGPASSAVIELADGSRVQLSPSSLAQITASRRYGVRVPAAAASSAAAAAAANPQDGWFASAMRVARGSVEIVATKVLRIKPLEVVTPTAVIGVRGTQYRVGVDASDRARSRSEVLEGKVRFDTAAGNSGADLPTGFGAAADAGGAPPQVARLLAAPDLTAVPARFERPLVRFALPGETRPLRVQVAADPAFDRLVSEQKVEPGGEVRIAGLDDAQWYLRARRIDVQGIEGFDATRSFVLKARPEPPATLAPRAGAKQAVGTVEFAWTRNTLGPRVHLQVADDAAFTHLVLDRDALIDATVRADLAAPGSYFWRLASIRDNGDAGPFGDAQRFELRPTPEPPTAGRSADGSALIFKWGGQTPARHQVQLARDAAFTQIVAEAELDTSEWTLPTPSRGGRYHFRYRSIEPDGFVSPYSEPLQLDVPRDWSLLWLLLPLLPLL